MDWEWGTGTGGWRQEAMAETKCCVGASIPPPPAPCHRQVVKSAGECMYIHVTVGDISRSEVT